MEQSPLEGVKNSKPRRKRADLSVRQLRSAVTNGSHLFVHIDHRGATMRRLRDLIALYTSDLGGEDFVSEAVRCLIRRAAMLQLQCELLDQRFAQAGGEATSAQLIDYQRTSSALRRILESLGLERRAKPVMSLEQYIAQEEPAA